MIKKFKNYFIIALIFLSIVVFCFVPIILCLPLLKEPVSFSSLVPSNETNASYSDVKKNSPKFDTITGPDGLPHYRVFFWVPKTATTFLPYADAKIKTDVSSHGPVEKWSVIDTKITNVNEKLVFIFVPKTFVYLYGNGFEKVIHLKCS